MQIATEEMARTNDYDRAGNDNNNEKQMCKYMLLSSTEKVC